MKLHLKATSGAARRPFDINTAPSVRLAVTPGTRALLRRLRAAERAAWLEAEARPGRKFRIRLSGCTAAPLFRVTVHHV